MLKKAKTFICIAIAAALITPISPLLLGAWRSSGHGGMGLTQSSSRRHHHRHHRYNYRRGTPYHRGASRYNYSSQPRGYGSLRHSHYNTGSYSDRYARRYSNSRKYHSRKTSRRSLGAITLIALKKDENSPEPQKNPEPQMQINAPGPHGFSAVAKLPDRNITKVKYNGKDYLFDGWYYYYPYYHAGNVWYEEISPFKGTYIKALPPEATQEIINEKNYFFFDGVFMEKTEKGFKVIEDPTPQKIQPPKPANENSKVLSVLKKMSDALTQVNSWSVKAECSFDEVMANGAVVTLSDLREIFISRPDKFKITINGDEQNKNIYYDGKTISIFDINHNFYGTIDAPPTIPQAADALSQQHLVNMPLADLLYPNFYEELVRHIESSVYVGKHKVDQTPCHHIAITEKNLDWEIWIQANGDPVPRKVVIVYKNDPIQPRFIAKISDWQLNRKFAESTFVFNPPKDAQKIQVLTEIK